MAMLEDTSHNLASLFLTLLEVWMLMLVVADKTDAGQ
jgi:hypothetical protein